MNDYRKMIIFAAAFTLVNVFISDVSVAGSSLQSVGNKKADATVSHRLGIGLTYHKAHSDFEELPFGDGDLSYGFSYEYHEGIGYWLIGVDLTPSIEDNSLIEQVVTPRLSLIIKDRIYRAGIGVLKSYISDKGDLVDDTDLYYQFSAGIGIPLFNRFGLDISSMYCFEKWRGIDFEFKDIEFGIIFNYML